MERFRTAFTLIDNSHPQRRHTKEAIATLERSIEEDPNESIRHRAQELDLCSSTLWKILWKDLGLRAYKIQILQKLKPNDHQARRRLVEWAQNEIAVIPDFHKRILFSDEAHFWLNGCVNKQKCHIRSGAKPQVYVETPLRIKYTGLLYKLRSRLVKSRRIGQLASSRVHREFSTRSVAQ